MAGFQDVVRKAEIAVETHLDLHGLPRDSYKHTAVLNDEGAIIAYFFYIECEAGSLPSSLRPRMPIAFLARDGTLHFYRLATQTL